jgi:predicted O-linked N-acetylglucosamine transferase (SPINDLY family)
MEIIHPASRRNVPLPAHLLSRWQDLFRCGNLRDCENLARKLIDDYPQTGKAWQLLGASLLASARPAEAAQALRKAGSLAPSDWSIWDNLAIALQRQGDFAGAAETFRIGLKHAPGEARLWSNASVNALESGDPPTALMLAWEAIRLEPNLAAAHLNAGNALSASGQSREAEAVFRQALSIHPDYVQALLSLGRELSRRGQLIDAIEMTRRALALKPDYADAHVNLAHDLNALGDVAAAAEHYRHALALKPELTSAGSGALYCLLHDDRQTPQQVAAAHMQFGEQLETSRKVHWKAHANNRDRERRLRLGFVSADLRNHPVARFLEPVWRELDRDRFALFAYDVQPARDAIAFRLRDRADQWTTAASMPDAQLDACIRADGIDILFDLSGHTARNRLALFARKPAPIQVSWIGYPGTTGLTTMDYRLVDSVVAPPRRFEHLFSEHLAYLPFLSVFDRPANLPEVQPSPLARGERLTFGSFNRINKLGDRTLRLWSQVLKSIPDSRLLIGALPNAQMETEFRARFRSAGIDAGRLLFRQRLALAEYLELHAQVDILLDTLPFSSGTTANFALWMGVPTLTLAGDSMAQRLGATRMIAAGLDAFVADSEDAYLDLAVTWSNKPDELTRIRGELRGRMEEMSRVQPVQITRALEQRLLEMWRRWCAGLAPEHLQ